MLVGVRQLSDYSFFWIQFHNALLLYEICRTAFPLVVSQGKLVTFFSSPEHEVLMVSYCDQSLSVVRHPCVVNFFALNDFSSKTAGRILK